MVMPHLYVDICTHMYECLLNFYSLSVDGEREKDTQKQSKCHRVLFLIRSHTLAQAKRCT